MTHPPVSPVLLRDAVDIAIAAGKLTTKWFRSSSLNVETKGDGSPVTQADKAAERAIREELAAKYPDSSIVGEEEGASSSSGKLTWYIDPIDGTIGFTKGVPLYSTLLAAYDEHGPAVGVVYLPATEECVWAGRGLGAHTPDGIAKVSNVSQMKGAIVTSSEVGRWPVSVFSDLQGRGANIRGWGDGFGFYLVATGKAEVMFDFAIEAEVAHPWDFAPMPVILREAGGRFTSIDGSEDINSPSMFASNGQLHDEMLKLVEAACGE